MGSVLRTIRVLGVGPTLAAARIRRVSTAILRGFYTTRAIIALFNVGFFAELAERRAVHVPSFAAAHNLDPRVLAALCTYLYSLRILTRCGDHYALDPSRRDIAELLNGPFYSVYAYQEIFHNLEALLRKEQTFGREVGRRSAYVARGSGAAGKLLAFPMIADGIRRAHYQQALDLCCGDATFLIDLCERGGLRRAYGVDIAPDAIAIGTQNVADHQLSDRIQLVTADALRLDELAPQFAGIDVATCVYALHEFVGGDNGPMLELLRRFRSGFPGVPLVVCEVIRHTPEELRRAPGGVLEIQLWHDLSHQRLLSRREWRALFEQAGFGQIREDYLGFARTAIFTVC